MKAKHDQLRPLLDEVMPDAAVPTGPDCAAVLGMVREERTRRRQRRLVLGTVALVGGLFVLSSYQASHQSSAPGEVPVVAAVLEQPVIPPVQRINDDELLALLQDAGTASALMEWPNGERTLLIVEHR